MKQLIIFPFNGNGMEALDCLGDEYELIGFVDDDQAVQGRKENGIVVYARDFLTRYPQAKVLAVPGSPLSFRSREGVINSLQLPADRFAKIIHPGAMVSPRSQVGFNTLVMAGTVITSHSRVGNHVCILPNAVIHHDSSVGDFCLIGSGVTVAGFTNIEKGCYIGSGSTIINNITVGSGTLVGMGSNVIRSVPAHSKIGGNPARSL